MKILFFANTEWYLFNFRLGLARYLRELGHEVVMLSPPGPYVEKLQAAGFRALTLPMRRISVNPLRELSLMQAIWRVYHSERPNLVHHFTIKCVVYGSLIARLQRIPARVNAVTGLGHVFSSKTLKARVLRPMVRALLKLALSGRRSRLILQNPDDLAAFRSARLICAGMTHVIRGSGVDSNRFHPSERQTDASTCRFLVASRMLWEKGIREYVHAAEQLRAEGCAAEFLVAGIPDAGNPSSIPQEQLDEWAASGEVQFLGHVDDMPALWSRVDVAVLPSDREGTPRSMLEAAACGLPLITTDVPGCREIVDPEINGLFVRGRQRGGRRRAPILATGDHPSLVDAMRRLSVEPETRHRMGAASRLKVLAEFDERIVFERTLAVYRELTNRGVC